MAANVQAGSIEDAELTRSVREAIRDELERSRRETGVELTGALRRVVGLYAASLFLYLAVVFLTLMCVYVIGTVFEPWMGAAAVGGTVLIVALLASRRAWRSFEAAIRSTAGGTAPEAVPVAGAELARIVRAVARDELARSQQQSRAELAVVGRGVAALFAASLIVYLAVVFLTLMCVYIMGTMIEPWMAAAIVGGIVLVASQVVFRRTRRSFRSSMRSTAAATPPRGA